MSRSLRPTGSLRRYGGENQGLPGFSSLHPVDTSSSGQWPWALLGFSGWPASIFPSGLSTSNCYGQDSIASPTATSAGWPGLCPERLCTAPGRRLPGRRHAFPVGSLLLERARGQQGAAAWAALTGEPLWDSLPQCLSHSRLHYLSCCSFAQGPKANPNDTYRGLYFVSPL